jgi:hypothetical protein
MSKHTPGPWRYSEAYGYIDSVNDTIVDLGDVRTETERANARLIAAAPELLAACKFLLTQCNSAGLDTLGGPFQAEFHEARAAIAQGDNR